MLAVIPALVAEAARLALVPEAARPALVAEAARIALEAEAARGGGCRGVRGVLTADVKTSTLALLLLSVVSRSMLLPLVYNAPNYLSYNSMLYLPAQLLDS